MMTGVGGALLVLGVYVLAVAVFVATYRPGRYQHPAWLPERLRVARTMSQSQAAENVRLLWMLTTEHPEARCHGAACAVDWSMMNGYNWRDRPGLTVVLIWAARLDPGTTASEQEARTTRADLLDAIVSVGGYDELQASALWTWTRGLDLSCDEEGYQAELAEFARDVPDLPPPDSVHCTQGITLLRGLVDPSVILRRAAVRSLLEHRSEFDDTEQSALAMALVNAAVNEDDETTLSLQLDALATYLEHGALHREQQDALRSGFRDRLGTEGIARHLDRLTDSPSG